MVDEELRIYETHTLWLLGEFEANLRAIAPALLVAPPPVHLEGNNLLAIAKHAAGVTRAYVLGMGCGQPATRDRSTEFTATEAESAAILGSFHELRTEIPRAFATLDMARLDVPFMPERSLYGTGDLREMTARDAIVNNIRHLGIHLGELRLTRSLLEARNL
jgi:hypothetical protein